jgi:branched-chain amino acid transport system permease protein
MSRKVAVGFALLCACLIPLILRGEEYYLHLYIVCAINVILASSLRPMALTGQMSIGQAGFMAIGAYTSAILSTRFGFHVYGAMLAGGLAAMVVAAIIGFPLSRIRTVYFVTVTMFFGEIVRLVIFEWSSVTGGSTGMMNIPKPEAFSVFGLFQVDPSTKFQFCYLALGLLLLILLVLRNIDRSHLGTVIGAVGQEESLASSVGIGVAHYKVLIFCVCTFFTGLAGSLYAHYLTLLNPDAFGITSSLYILIYFVVGGRKIVGPVVGAIILTLIPEAFRGLKEYQPFVFVLVLFLVVFLLPGGLTQLPSRIGTGVKGILNGRSE